MTDVNDIGRYHAHVYFDAETVDRARTVCEAARDKFGLMMGRVHEKEVGPHPMWSCQLMFPAEQFAEVIPWLNVNRDGLIVFVHPLTGDDLYDHRDAPMWLGESVPLKLEMFLKDAQT
jgi:aromatic ring-cleaving dioxygenase